MTLQFAPSRHRLLLAWLLVSFVLLSSLLSASASADPVGRVGRIAWLSGSVHLHRADSGESSSALLNWPLTTGDILSTAAGARSEVQLGSTSVQLDSSSILEFVAVDDQRVRLRLLDGSVIVRLRSPEAAAEFELSTRDGSFDVPEAGSYRFDVERSGTVATVHAGSLHFAASDRAIDLRAGQRAQLWNDGRTRYYVSAPVEDAFFLWSTGRDQRPASPAYERHVSPEMTGAADLDAYGRWRDSPEYGAVWFPQAVAADWAPYRNGRWAWVAPWGWTWVGDEPWGFAPFHYGRWVLYGGAWGWVPGTRVARPVYAPALVAWVGSPGAGVSLQVGARPAVGWFPLAPREIYVPPYRSSVNYVRQVNVTHVTQINNITTITGNPQAAVERMPYAHRQMSRAVTMVPADVVAQQRPIDRAAMLQRDGRPLGTQSVQVQAPVAAPQLDAGRGREGRRPFPQDGRERDAAAARGEGQTGGRGDQVERHPAAAPAGMATGQPVAPPPVAPTARTEAVSPTASPTPRPPVAAAGQRPEAGAPMERARPEGEGPQSQRSERLGGRGEQRQQRPLPGAASPMEAGSSVPPVAPSAAQAAPGTENRMNAPASRQLGAPAPLQVPGGGPAALPGAAGVSQSGVARRAADSTGAGDARVQTAPAAPVRTPAVPPAVAPAVAASPVLASPATGARPDGLPAAAAVRGTQSAERPAAAVGRSAPGAGSGRPEERNAPPAPVASPAPALPRFPERPAVAAPAAAQVPAVERFDTRGQPHRSDEVPRREEAFARQRRQEAPVNASPSVVPQRPMTSPGGLDSPSPNERRSRSERRPDTGGQREGRGDGRPDQSSRGPDG